MRILTIALLFLALPVLSWSQAGDPAKLLEDAEISRGVMAANGIQWTVKAEGESDGEDRNATLIVKAQGPFALAEIVAPITSKGKRYLLADGEMWFYKPGTKRAISVPKRQRVTGDAAIGDIASTSFLSEYVIAGTQQDKLGGEACTVFELAKRPGANPTYNKVVLWVSNSKRVAKQANYYTVSGKEIRTASFKHNNTVTVGGKEVPFLSELKVVELAGAPKTTTLFFTDYSIRKFPNSMFDKDKLAQP